MRENYGGFGAERQGAIYRAGATGQPPRLPISPEQLEAEATKGLPAETADYVAGGAGAGSTVGANRAEFDRWHLLPRMLRDVHARDLTRELFGVVLPAPVLLAPIGGLATVRTDGELAVARAAASLGVPFVASTLTSASLEEIAAASGTGRRWFQLYWGPDRDLNLSLVQRAEAAGYSAIVVTVDTRLLAWRERDLTRGYLPFLTGAGLGNYLSDPIFRARLERPPGEDPVAAARLAIAQIGDPTFVWSDVQFLADRVRVPIVVKGILHPEDASAAMEAGANGLIVSNHGGRQVDGSVPALRALPAVVAEVGGRVPVLFDSGIRRGSDALKALALGAQAVLLGRLYAWGLALDGESGVREAVENFLADLDLTLAEIGCARLSDLGRQSIAPA
ncbi:MAG TPA: alpha-hydroxy-acid oxidizing protein [Thermoplasmata archaeon]|nr:alpha-hydroxy-acid oxidizing protein [Thermoplasmata archaeon]